MPRINLIAAVARNGTIGRNGRIPWKIPGELAYFKQVTMGHPIVMGRRTWESIGRPLPGRRNIVVSRSLSEAPGAEVVNGVEAALALAAGAEETFVIGGGELYAQALARAGRMFLTEIDADFDGDAFFPPFDRTAWREIRRERRVAHDDCPSYAFVVYER